MTHRNPGCGSSGPMAWSRGAEMFLDWSDADATVRTPYRGEPEPAPAALPMVPWWRLLLEMV